MIQRGTELNLTAGGHQPWFARSKLVHSRDFVLALAVACLVAGCLQNGTGGSNSGSSNGSSKSLTSSGGSTGSSSITETQCNIFKNNSNDYAVCLSCKTSLCPCTSFASNGSTCTGTNI